MKNLLKILLSVLILYTGIEIKPAQFDTGMIELKQPDETTFTGRIWGDDFFWWAETEDGYRFIQSGDGWYYYATLNQDGEFAPTIYKVGIDTPPTSSYQLERTQARIDEINQMIEEFIEQVELNKQWFEQKQAEAQGQPVTLKVGLILIEFTYVKHYEDENYRPDGYFTADFDSMMFSYNYWYAPNPQFDSPHPENELVFGSFRDYWNQISRGELIIEGRVVNPTDEGSGVPKWLTADYDRQHYVDLYAGFTILANEAVQKAVDAHYISLTPGDPNYYDNLAIIYAQNPIRGITSTVGPVPNSNRYICGEQMGLEIYGQDKSFTHIGLHLWSFGVNIGFYDGPDEYGVHPTMTLNFDLMNTGWANGPFRKGECPATIAPYFRIEKKWVEPITITKDTSNFLVEYDYNNPKLYRINPIDAPGNMHYLFEVRQREGFDLYIPEPPETYQNQSGTLLIWQDSVEFWFAGFFLRDKIRLKLADYNFNFSTQLNDFFPSESYNNNQSLNDTTLPAASLGDLLDEYDESYIRPAHFALNGIHKLENGNALIDEIKLNHAIIRNKISSGWKTVSVGAILSDYSASSVFPTAISPVYGYVPGQGYIVRTTLANGPGYWVNFASAQTLVHAGLILDSINIPVVKGWNLIGSISDKVPKLNICTEPPGLIISMYYYDGGYNYLTNSDSLKPGKGYWLNSTSNGNIILLRNFECPESEEFNLASMDKFIITDADGKTQDLYVANVDIDTTIAEVDRSLPPALPVIDFDARFNYGEFIKAVSVDSGEVDLEIDVQTYAYPLTLSWEINPANGIEYSFLSDSGFNKISSLKNILNSKLTIGENSKGKIKLFGKVGNSLMASLPEKFELLQNYPNPFNPITTIKYDLPFTSDVSLIIYDILGRKVKELVNTKQQAGRNEVLFDASNLASGIYFYQLKTKDFVSTKKMILMK